MPAKKNNTTVTAYTNELRGSLMANSEAKTNIVEKIQETITETRKTIVSLDRLFSYNREVGGYSKAIGEENFAEITRHANSILETYESILGEVNKLNDDTEHFDDEQNKIKIKLASLCNELVGHVGLMINEKSCLQAGEELLESDFFKRPPYQENNTNSFIFFTISVLFFPFYFAYLIFKECYNFSLGSTFGEIEKNFGVIKNKVEQDAKQIVDDIRKNYPPATMKERIYHFFWPQEQSVESGKNDERQDHEQSTPLLGTSYSS